jgi:ethanolamine ammonia-lyase large subunit
MYSFVCILSVIALASCASTPIVPIEDRSIQKVHAIDLTKDEIYDISLEWMAKTLIDTRGVFELKNKDKDKIIGTGQTYYIQKSFWGPVNVPCRFTVMVEAKENKYKTTYNNFIGLLGKSNGRLKPVEEKEHIDFVKAKLAIIDDGLYGYLKKYKSNTNW